MWNGASHANSVAPRRRRIGPARLRGLAAGLWVGFVAVLACGAEGAGSDTATPRATETAAPVVSGAVAAIPMVAADGEVPSLAPLLDGVRPGVVNISVRGVAAQQMPPPLNDPRFRRFFDVPEPSERQFRSAGSGVIVDAERGLILTNHHVIDRADEITVTLMSGEQRKAEVVGSDREADVAVIRIEADDLVAVPAGDSDVLRVGDFVLAIGNPFGLGQTVTSGIVSALGRSGLQLEAYEDFIQTDASINPGNSGGALINLRGQLIGINTAIFSGGGAGNIGIGFAIPINMARSLMNQILEFGEVRRGQLGVLIQDLTPELAKAFGLTATEGALVSQVVEGSAAARAGIKQGDVVIAMNGDPVRSSAELRNRGGLEPIGTEVKLDILRDGKKRTVSAELGAREQTAQAGGDDDEPPSPSRKAVHPKLQGVTLQEGGADSPGVLVVEVDPSSNTPLRPGDIIREVNRQPVSNLSTLRKAAGKDGPLLLLVEREGRTFFVYLE